MSSTDSFVVSQLFGVARHAVCFKLGSKPAELYARFVISLFSHFNDIRQLRIFNSFVLAFVCLDFALFYTRVLNSLEEACITQITTVNFFTRVSKGSVYFFEICI